MIKIFIAFGVAGVLLKLIRDWMQGPKCTSTRRLDGKTVVITGANTGIGKVCAKELGKRGAKVIILCRSLERANAAAKEIREEGVDIQVEQMDLASLQSVRDCAQRLNTKLEKIDILLNNAGVMVCPEMRTEEGFEMQIGTNHFGHFLLTNLLLPLLKKGGEGTRVVTVSSLAHEQGKMYFEDINWKKTPYSAMSAYQQSKLANVLFSNELSDRLKPYGINSYSLHPGVIITELGRHIGDTYGKLALILGVFVLPFMKTVENGAQTSLYCCLDETLDHQTGRYYSDCREKLAAPQALSKEDAKNLWDLSEQLTGIK